MNIKKSTWFFIGAALIMLLWFIVQSIGFVTARTEAELMARSSRSGDLIWFVFAAICIAIAGFWQRKKEKSTQ